MRQGLQQGTAAAGPAAHAPLPDGLQRLDDGMFPLFVSSTKLLRMVDGCCAEPFFPRAEDGRILEHIGDDGMH